MRRRVADRHRAKRRAVARLQRYVAVRDRKDVGGIVDDELSRVGHDGDGRGREATVGIGNVVMEGVRDTRGKRL